MFTSSIFKTFLSRNESLSLKNHFIIRLSWQAMRSWKLNIKMMETVFQRCFKKKYSWKHSANLQVNTNTEVWFQENYKATAWVFCCKFTAYFQSTFSWKNLWKATSEMTTFTFHLAFKGTVMLRNLNKYRLSKSL